MTIITIGVAGDMCGVFASCSYTVMAGATTSQYLCVVDRSRRCPYIAVVAVFTDIRCLNVGQILARGVQPVVAAYAIAGDVQVVEGRRSPCNCRVAIVAGFAADEVCRVLAGCNNAIVTGVAGADDLRVVDRVYGCKYVGVMAVLANIARLDVFWILTSGIYAVVAINTGTGDVQMIKVRRQPGNRRVAVVTGFATGDMRGILAAGCDAVMTGSASTYDLCMVDYIHWCPNIGIVAVLTDIRCLNVCGILAGCSHAVMAVAAVINDFGMVEVGR